MQLDSIELLYAAIQSAAESCLCVYMQACQSINALSSAPELGTRGSQSRVGPGFDDNNLMCCARRRCRERHSTLNQPTESCTSLFAWLAKSPTPACRCAILVSPSPSRVPSRAGLASPHPPRLPPEFSIPQGLQFFIMHMYTYRHCPALVITSCPL